MLQGKLKILDNTLFSVKTYDCCADIYEQRFMDTSAYHERVNEFCSYFLTPRAKILDLGCGPGNFSRYLCNGLGFKNIHGIDLSEEMVRKAGRNVPSGVFYVADIRKLSYAEASFHGIFASFIVQYLAYHETEKLIKNVAHTLKPSGMLYLSCLEGTNTGFEQTSFSGEMAVYIYYYTEDFLVNAMEESGLQIHSVNRQIYKDINGAFQTDLIIIAQKAD